MTEQHVMEVSATEAALDLIQELKGKYGDDLIFHQSGGCCDGSAPMCYEAKDFFLGDQDVKLGEITNPIEKSVIPTPYLLAK